MRTELVNKYDIYYILDLENWVKVLEAQKLSLETEKKYISAEIID